MLSEPEQRALDAIEQQMHTEDPDFCRTLDSPLDRSMIHRRRWLFAGAVVSGVLGVLTAVLGALALSFGLIFMGCLVTGVSWGAYMLLRQGPVLQQQTDGPPPPRGGPGRDPTHASGARTRTPGRKRGMTSSESVPFPHVVIVGAGFAGFQAARSVRRRLGRDRPDHDRQSHQLLPLPAAAARGRGRDPRSATDRGAAAHRSARGRPRARRGRRDRRRRADGRLRRSRGPARRADLRPAGDGRRQRQQAAARARRQRARARLPRPARGALPAGSHHAADRAGGHRDRPRGAGGALHVRRGRCGLHRHRGGRAGPDVHRVAGQEPAAAARPADPLGPARRGAAGAAHPGRAAGPYGRRGAARARRGGPHGPVGAGGDVRRGRAHRRRRPDADPYRSSGASGCAPTR